MTPSERERRIEAAMGILDDRIVGTPDDRTLWRKAIADALDAADEAVPVVPATWDGLLEHLDAMYPVDVFTGESGDAGARLVVLAQKLAEAEAAARDFAEALREISDRKPGSTKTQVEGMIARDALGRHPSFSGEEGTEG